MAYVNPLIRLRENGHHIARGCYWDGAIGRHIFQATQDETFRAIVNATDLLDGATITAAATSDGLTVTPTVNAGVVTLAITGVSDCYAGDIDLTLTFSDGRIMLVLLRVTDPFAWGWRSDYLPARAYPVS